MSIDGFRLEDKGPAAGLVWVDFSNIVVDGEKGTPAYLHAMQQKAAVAMRVMTTELNRGTRHFNRDRKPLKTIHQLLASYQVEGGFYVELKGAVRGKMEGLVKAYGGSPNDRN